MRIGLEKKVFCGLNNRLKKQNTFKRASKGLNVFVAINSTFASSNNGASGPNPDLLFVLIQKVSKNLIN